MEFDRNAMFLLPVHIKQRMRAGLEAPDSGDGRGTVDQTRGRWHSVRVSRVSGKGGGKAPPYAYPYGPATFILLRVEDVIVDEVRAESWSALHSVRPSVLASPWWFACRLPVVQQQKQQQHVRRMMRGEAVSESVTVWHY